MLTRVMIKFMSESPAAQKLTESFDYGRSPRRVIIATEKPTISSRLLDLCSFTLVHRFTYPDWLKVLKNHLAAVSLKTFTRNDSDILERILVVGEAKRP